MSTVDVSTQPRRPGGAAGGAGGQFATKTNSPPEGTLAESATGSFLYPPERFDTVEEYLEFFDAAPISDQVLSNASHAYRTWRKKAILTHVQQRYEAFGNDKSSIGYRMARDHGVEGLNAAVAAERPKWIAEAEAMYPVDVLPRPQARSVLRAHQIVVLRGMLDEQDQEAALEHQIQYRDEVVSARDLYHHYNTEEWARAALTESDYAQSEAMNRVASLLAEAQGITDYDDFH